MTSLEGQLWESEVGSSDNCQLFFIYKVYGFVCLLFAMQVEWNLGGIYGVCIMFVVSYGIRVDREIVYRVFIY